MTRSRDNEKGLEIQVLNECPHPGVNEKKLEKVAARILRDLGFKKALVSILLVPDSKMRVLNRKYLKHAWSTDVLAFGQGKITGKTRGTRKESAGRSTDFLGDIVLCIPTIETQADEYGHSFEEELDYCLCHGILHLLGHEDKTRRAKDQMHLKQKQILKRVLSPSSGS
jgi:probable rRNA maturation factor